MDEALFFESGHARLFGVLHTPDPDASPTPLGLVICAPIADEHVAAYRILRVAAERFCEAGVAVMRFDYHGQGDSEGDFEQMTPDRMVSDTLCAMDVLRERTGARQFGLLGLRIGCAIALRAAALDSRVGSCVSWAPILSPERYFRDLLRRKVLSDVMYGEPKQNVKELVQRLGNGDTIDIGGYALAGGLYEPLCAVEFAGQISGSGLAMFAALAAHGGKPAEELAKKLAEQPDTRVHQIEEEPFWKFPNEGSLAPLPERLIDETAAWLQDRARSPVESV